MSHWESLAHADSPLAGRSGLQGDDLQPERDSGGSEGMYFMDGLDQPYACVDNLEACSKYLANTLAGLGIPAQLDFLSHKPEAVVSIVNCMHSLVKQRQQDREAREQLEAAVRKLRFDSQVIQNERNKLEDQLKDKYTELGTLEIKVRQAERATKEASSEACSRADKSSRQMKQLQASLQQADVRVRQRDIEIQTLKQKLTAALASKRSSAVGADAGDTASEAGVSTHTRASAPGGLHTAGGSVSGGGAGVEGGRRQPRNAQSSALVTSLQQELERTKRLAAASDQRAHSLAADNTSLHSQLADLRRDFTQLLQRCNSLNVGVAACEVGSMQAAATAGGAGPRGSSSSTARDGGKASHVTDAELHKYMATDLKLVQARCQQLLSKGAPPASPSADTPGKQHISTVMAMMADQDKALSRALVSLKRAEAQRDAAQQRAAATQQRVLLLEKRLTEACTASNTQQEAMAQLQQRCRMLESQLAQATAAANVPPPGLQSCYAESLDPDQSYESSSPRLYNDGVLLEPRHHHQGRAFGVTDPGLHNAGACGDAAHPWPQPESPARRYDTGQEDEHGSVDLAQGWLGGAGQVMASPSRMPHQVLLPSTADSPLPATGLPCVAPAQQQGLHVDVRASYEQDVPWGTPARLQLGLLGDEGGLSSNRPMRKTWVIPPDDLTPSPREMLQQSAPDWE